MEKTVENAVVDQEWVMLIQSAKNLGMTIEEIRQFLLKEGTIVS